jgi:small subunit ribosomal protein S29
MLDRKKNPLNMFLLLLQDFLKYNETRLLQLPCQIFEPIPLGEGAGVGKMKGADTVEMPEGSTLYDLIQTGITHTHASVGVVVRLRKELSLVKDVPVLFAIDQVCSSVEIIIELAAVTSITDGYMD